MQIWHKSAQPFCLRDVEIKDLYLNSVNLGWVCRRWSKWVDLKSGAALESLKQ